MPDTISIAPAAAATSVGLEGWMKRVLERVQETDKAWDAESVHGLRVALRRCRTMADAMSEVNPDPCWRKIRRTSRDLFRSIGELRDLQVEKEWAKRLTAPRDPVRAHLLRRLSHREREQQKTAREVLADFHAKEWKKLARRVEHKAELFPLESVVFQRLALARLDEAATLFDQARRNRSGAAWHRARIGLKKFRYIAENFLPRRYAPWKDDVKRLQDLLGDVHDLEVLRLDLRRQRAGLDPASVEVLLEKIRSERKERLAAALPKAFGSKSVLREWRSGLSLAHPLIKAPLLHRQTA